MAYDPARVTITDWDNELVSDTKLNQMLNNIDHNYNYKLGIGPDTTGKLQMARGTNYAEWGGSSGNAGQTIIFATDSDDGDPDFEEIPRIIVIRNITGGEDGGNGLRNAIIIDFISTISFTASFYDGGIPPAGSRAYFDWIAIGRSNI